MTTESEPDLSPRVSGALIALALLLTGLGYARVLHGEFQLDDAHVIERNTAVKEGASAAVGLHAFSLSSRPLTALTFAANYAIGRLDTFSYHAVNVAIHLAVVLLLWRLALVLLRRAGTPHAGSVAVATAGVFALHPLATQAVSYVAQRSESLAALFATATILLLCKAEDGGSLRRRLALGAFALAAFALGLGAKLTAIVAPALWLLAAALSPSGSAPLQRTRKAIPLLAPIALVALAAAGAMLVHLRGRTDAGFSAAGTDAWSYLLSQTRAILLYLRLLVWPAGQSVDHDLSAAGQMDATSLLLGAAYVASMIAALRVLLRPPAAWDDATRSAARVAALGVLWWFVALAPTSSVVPVIDAAVEHRAYLASFGPIFGIAALVGRLLSLAPAGRRGAAALVLGACAWLSLAVALHARNAVWESKLALWSDAAAKAPRKIRPQANLAFALQGRGELEGAIAGYRRALTLGDDPIVTREELEQYLGAALVQAGRPAEALPLLGAALQRDPWNLALLNTTAITLLDLGRLAEAEQLARASLEISPAFGSGLNTLGEVLLAQDRAPEALTAFRRAAEIDRDVALRHLNVARVAARLGQTRVACDALRQHRSAGGTSQEAVVLEASQGCPP